MKIRHMSEKLDIVLSLVFWSEFESHCTSLWEEIRKKHMIFGNVSRVVGGFLG